MDDYKEPYLADDYKEPKGKDTSRGQIETDSVRRRMVFPPVIDDHCSAFPLCRQIMTGEKDPKQTRLVG